MRDGAAACRLRLGDRVRWVPEEYADEIKGDPVGTVRGLRRNFPRSPDLSLDKVHIDFDERVGLIDGMGGFKELWVPSEHAQPEAQDA
ncbi:MAG: hypothetical protein V3T24_02935 [Longimicrobiales bacterium]